MKNSMISIMLTVSLLGSPIYANQEQVQQHLKALLGDLQHLEKQVNGRKSAINGIAPGSKYRIKTGDSLDKIAARAYGETNLRLDLVKQLIVSNNPKAFFRNNANFIYADKIIAIPSVDDFRQMLFTSDTDSSLNAPSDNNQWIRFP